MKKTTTNKIRKYCKENKFICIVAAVVFFLVALPIAISLNLLSATGDDFTHTDTEVSGSYIQLQDYYPETTHSNPRKNGNPLASDTSVRTATMNQFCDEQDSGYTGSSYIYSGSGTPNTAFYTGSSWSTMNTAHSYSSITCIASSSEYKVSGSLVQTNPVTTTEPYNTFELQYNEVLNGGSIDAYLIVGTTEYQFDSNNRVELSSNVPSDTQLKVRFDLEGSTSSTPQIENDIVLLGSIESSSSSSSSSSPTPASIISTLTASPDIDTEELSTLDFYVENFKDSTTTQLSLAILAGLIIIA